VIVNFGCGSNPAPPDAGYVNVDGSLTILLAKLPVPAAAFGQRADFVRVIRANRIHYGTARSLKLPESSLDGFYASHVLEHLSTHDCEGLLLRALGWLKPSGVLRVVLPDLKRFAASYIAGTTDAHRFVANTNLAVDGQRWWETLLGHSQHRWMYDANSFSGMLVKLGFRNVKEFGFGQGQLTTLNCLDIPSRESESFYMEASK
jgi:predicted SAM-dependent methyltransferase